MFDKDLFLSLCNKYNVELSSTASAPMIKDSDGIHEISADDFASFFEPMQEYFNVNVEEIQMQKVHMSFDLVEKYAIAC